MKRTITAIISLILCITLLTGCDVSGLFDNSNPNGNSNGENDNGGSDGNDGDNATTPDGVIFDKNSKVQFVISDSTLPIDIPYYLYTNFSKVLDEIPDMTNDSASVEDKEIVIGKSKRNVSKTAYQLLENINYNEKIEARFLVYTDGNSIAFAYDQDLLGNNAAVKKCIYRFTDLYVKNQKSFSHDEGIIFSGKINLIDYQEELDDAEIKAKFENTKKQLLDKGINEALADEIVKELKAYNEVYDDNVGIWLANLYDPEIGGFYYSNAARDIEGFLPDIESTQQALSFLRTFYNIEIPEKMKNDIAKWIKGLQNPNGYFYHPQWSKATTDKSPSRLGRDLNSAIGLLNLFGYSPTYDTPLGHKGDGLDSNLNPISSDYSLTSRLSSSKVSAVSKVVATSSVEVPERLQNKENFIKYLNSLDINNRSYGAGNELAGQAQIIKARSEELIAEGADYSLVDILINWLNDHQNQETGLWTLYNTPDFDGANGLLKILAVYSGVERPFPNAIKAAKSAFAVLGNGEYLGSVCYVYNIWLTLRTLNTHIKKYNNDSNAEQEMKDLRAAILQDAPRAIRETAKAVSLFKKEDGSFSFSQEYSCQTSQGMYVTLRQQNEGDVNATTICVQGTFEFMYNVLGLSYVEPFTEADSMRILYTLENLEPVQKRKETVDNVPSNFDNEAIGSVPNYFLDIYSNSSGSIAVADDPRTNSQGNVLKFESKSDGYDFMEIRSRSSSLGRSCFIFESDMCFTKECPNGYYTQLYMAPGAYMLGFVVGNGHVKIFDSSSSSGNRFDQDLGIVVPLDQWFNLRVEYYVGDQDSVRVKVYLDGKLKAVSDNFYDGTGKKLQGENVETATEYTYTQLCMFSSSKGVILLDNLIATKSDEKYTKSNENLKVNVDYGR